MVRFTDEWVIDRTLFEYANGGSCACCGPMNLFLPDGVESTIQSISDIETDAAHQEVNALQNSPWPPEMRDDVWSSRLRLRMKMKQNRHEYQDFWNDHGDEFKEWLRYKLPVKQLKKLLQVPRQEVTSLVAEKYKVHSPPWDIVLCAITEQCANFCATGYPHDGVGSSEVDFESILKFDRRGGFTLPIVTKKKSENDKSTTTRLNEETLQILLNRIQSLGEGKLLDRKVSEVVNEEEEGDADEAEEENVAKPSFRSDRRVVRLLIARYWADALRNKYFKYKQEQQQQEEEEEALLNAGENENVMEPDGASKEE